MSHLCSAADLSVAIEKEAGRRVDMETIKDRLTDPAQARAFAAATRNTPRLLRLIAQGVYCKAWCLSYGSRPFTVGTESQIAPI